MRFIFCENKPGLSGSLGALVILDFIKVPGEKIHKTDYRQIGEGIENGTLRDTNLVYL